MVVTYKTLLHLLSQHAMVIHYASLWCNQPHLYMLTTQLHHLDLLMIVPDGLVLARTCYIMHSL
jgi:hypothetical protein